MHLLEKATTMPALRQIETPRRATSLKGRARPHPAPTTIYAMGLTSEDIAAVRRRRVVLERIGALQHLALMRHAQSVKAGVK